MKTFSFSAVGLEPTTAVVYTTYAKPHGYALKDNYPYAQHRLALV